MPGDEMNWALKSCLCILHARVGQSCRQLEGVLFLFHCCLMKVYFLFSPLVLNNADINHTEWL